MPYRRTFLKGLALGASATLLEPIAQQLHAYADGVAAGKRVVFVIEGNGMNERHVVPTMAVEALKALTGRGTAGGSNYDIDDPLIVEQIDDVGAKALQGLGDLVDETAVVSGMSYYIAGKGHSSDYGCLTASPGGSPAQASIDQFIAQQLGTTKPFKHVALGMVGTKSGPPPAVVYETTAAGKGKRSPVLTNPIIARRALFGSVAGEMGMAEFDMRTNLLDFMADDIGVFQRNLAGEEKLKLDYYLHAVETLRNRQTKLETLQTQLTANLPPETDIYSSEHPIFRLEATFELAASALIAGLTDVMLITSGTSNRNFGVKFTSFGEDFPGKHNLGHGGGYMGENASYWMGEIHNRHTAMIAELARKLKAVPEGDGTMWDNTLVVYTNCAGNQHHNRSESWPALLVGGKNIGLRLDGRCVLYPKHGKGKHRHFPALWNTVAHAMGTPIDDFGADVDAKAQGTLPEIMA